MATDRFKGVHPLIHRLEDEANEAFEPDGISVVEGQDGGFRDDEDTQKDLYNEGVSNADTLEKTPHSRGAAGDLLLVKGGKILPSSDPAWSRYGQIVKNLGLKWGGDFKSIKDLPHAEVEGWKKTKKGPITGDDKTALDIAAYLPQHLEDGMEPLPYPGKKDSNKMDKEPNPERLRSLLQKMTSDDAKSDLDDGSSDEGAAKDRLGVIDKSRQMARDDADSELGIASADERAAKDRLGILSKSRQMAKDDADLELGSEAGEMNGLKAGLKSLSIPDNIKTYLRSARSPRDDRYRRAQRNDDMSHTMNDVGRGLAQAGADFAGVKVPVDQTYDAYDKDIAAEQNYDDRQKHDLIQKKLSDEDALSDPNSPESQLAKSLAVKLGLNPDKITGKHTDKLLDMVKSANADNSRSEVERAKAEAKAALEKTKEDADAAKAEILRAYKDKELSLREANLAMREVLNQSTIDHRKVQENDHDDDQFNREKNKLSKLVDPTAGASYQKLGQLFGAIAKGGDSGIDGVGIIEGGLPKLIKSDKARQIAQWAQQLYNPNIKSFAGVSVSEREMANIEKALGMVKAGNSEQEFVQGLMYLQESLDSALTRALASTGDSKAREAWQAETGLYPRTGPGRDAFGRKQQTAQPVDNSASARSVPIQKPILKLVNGVWYKKGPDNKAMKATPEEIAANGE